jgi:fructose-specific phosphotransferase system IIC component
MIDAALLGFVIGFLAGISAMCFDISKDAAWGWEDAVTPIVLFPPLVALVFFAVFVVVHGTLLR